MARLQNGPSAPFFWSHKTLGPPATGAGASCWREWAVIEVACWRQKKKKIRRISVAAMVTGCNEGDVKEFGIFKFCGRLRELSLESFFVLFGDSTELAAKCDRHKQQAGLRKEVDYDKRLTTKKLRLNVEEDD